MTLPRHPVLPTGRRRDRAPLCEFKPYPGRRPTESARLCKLHNSPQKRVMTVRGPLYLAECKDLEEKKPRFSDNTSCQFFLWGWLIGTPDASSNKAIWYRIRVKGMCDHSDCGNHIDKIYRRRFSRLERFANTIKAIIFPNSFEFVK